MVMPNIGAFIAWGFITALFIEKGWLPNAQLATLNGPMLNYLLPVLIAFQGGKLIGGDRGGVMGAIATIGVIVGAPDYPMLMGAMLLAIVGYYAIGPFMSAVLVVLKGGVQVLVDHSLLPLAAIFIEPAKVLFLNNAINHGIFTPIGIEQAAEAGKSIMYMLEANPGPGLGLLLAYWAFSKDKATKDSAPGAIIIHFFGGIHEIYFPYILMNPLVIVGPIAGNICAILFYSITKAGLVGPSAPGSIIAFMSMSPKSSIVITALGVLIAATVSFLVSSPIVKMAGSKSLEDAQKKADQIIEDAKVEADKIKAGSAEKVSHVKADGMARAQSSADLKKRQTVLKAKQEIINEVIGKAYNGMIDMEIDRYFHMMERMIGNAVQPKNGQISFSAKDMERLPAGFAKRVSEIAKAHGGDLTLADKASDIDGGFILIYGGIEENCSLAAMFHAQKEEMADKLNSLLFT